MLKKVRFFFLFRLLQNFGKKSRWKKSGTRVFRGEKIYFLYGFFLPGKTLLDALEVETGMTLFLAMTDTQRVFKSSPDPIKGSYVKTQNFRQILSFCSIPPGPSTSDVRRGSHMGLRVEAAAAAET